MAEQTLNPTNILLRWFLSSQIAMFLSIIASGTQLLLCLLKYCISSAHCFSLCSIFSPGIFFISEWKPQPLTYQELCPYKWQINLGSHFFWNLNKILLVPLNGTKQVSNFVECGETKTKLTNLTGNQFYDIKDFSQNTKSAWNKIFAWAYKCLCTKSIKCWPHNNLF